MVGERMMVDWFIVIVLLVGMLSIIVYPKIIQWGLFAFIIYLTAFVNYWYAGLFIPLLLIILIYKRRKENGV